MNKLFFTLLAIGFIGLQACNNTAKEAKNTALAKTEIADKKESSLEVHKGSIHLTKNEFLEKVWDYETNSDKWEYRGDKPCIIDFYADWCGPCKIAAPILEELALEYADDIYVYKIDTEKERELAGAFGIQSIPAFLYCPVEGQPQMAAGIGRSPEETKQMFKNVIDEFLLGKK